MDKIKIAIMVPAIIDQECADMVTDCMRKNIIQANLDCDFKFLINIDDYRRKGDTGDVESISSSYNILAEEDNCVVDIVVHGTPLGLTTASRELFERFLKTDSEYLVFFDDDCELPNPIRFREFIHLTEEKDVTLHMAHSYDTISVENPFIQNNVCFEGETVRIFENNRVFMTENGTIFTRKMIEDILEEYCLNESKFNTSYNPEDVIGALDCYKKRPVWTITFKTENCVVDDIIDGTRKPWRLPKENHFIVDSIRHYKKVGWNK